MALLLSEGFDQYGVVADLLLRYTTNANSGYLASGGRFGGGAYTSNNDDLVLAMPLLTDGNGGTNTIHCAFWVKTAALPSSDDILFSFYESGGGRAGDFKLLTNGRISQMSFGGTITESTTAISVITAGVWHHMEVAVKYATSGTCKIWIDGTLVMDFSGDNDTAGNPEIIDIFRLEGHTNGVVTFDDVLVWDQTGTDFVLAQMNEHRIETLVPDGDSAVQFTPTGAGSTNADRVDEANFHDGDTTYNESTTLGHVDLLTIANQAVTPTTTHAIAVHTRAKKTDAGAVTMSNHIKHGLTEVEDNKSLTNSYSHYPSYFGKNPDTSSAWGTTDVDGLLAGYEYQA